MTTQVPLAATVLTGFLGSGKTTLLNALLSAPHGRRLAVIVNEFGAIGVDGALVQGGERFVQLDNGCLCCVLNEDLTQTLVELAQRGGFEQVIIETTGMADPLPVARTFDRAAVNKLYRMDAVVTVVDAQNLSAALAQAPEAAEQLHGADILVLNKVDLGGDLEATTALLRQHNQRAPLFSCARGAGLPWDLLLAHAPEGGLRRGDAPASAPTHAHAHAAEHGPSFDSYAYPSDAVYDELRLEDLLAELPPGVWRLKGIVRTNAPWNWTLVNAVAGRMEMRPFVGDMARVRPGLVFIGRPLQQAALQAACLAAQVSPGAK